MPIANCIVKHGLKFDDKNIIELWANASQVSSQNMTINLIRANEQLGKQYSVMATLYLPSVWAEEKRIALQVGLAAALSEGLGQPPELVHVVTLIVASGHVVENGEPQTW